METAGRMAGAARNVPLSDPPPFNARRESGANGSRARAKSPDLYLAKKCKPSQAHPAMTPTLPEREDITRLTTEPSEGMGEPLRLLATSRTTPPRVSTMYPMTVIARLLTRSPDTTRGPTRPGATRTDPDG